MVRLLVSVRDVWEALDAAEAGADLIDCKEPHDGALGALAPESIAQIVSVLRLRYPELRISATVGDLPAHATSEILSRAGRIASCGVDYVKVGLWPSSPATTGRLLDALAGCGAGIVPVVVVGARLDDALVSQVLRRGGFPAVMLDTGDKRAGSLLERVPLPSLASFVRKARVRGRQAGLAGSLRAEDVDALLSLAPDFAGFRGAVARGTRTGTLDPRLVDRLRRRLAPGAPARAGGDPGRQGSG